MASPEYDVAFSFAGSDREHARVLAAIARANGLRVFIDEAYPWEAWGKNLVDHLGPIYDGQARFYVVLISEDYCQRPYTNYERRRMLDHAILRQLDAILPVRLDDAWLAGLPRSTAYFDLRERTITEVGVMLVKKLKGDVEVTIPEAIPGPGVEPVDAPSPPGALRADGAALSFAAIQVAEECTFWKEQTPAGDDGPLSFYSSGTADPIFDVTILNRTDEAVLLSAVGLDVQQLGCFATPVFGGVWAHPVPLHRTYTVELPDLWAKLAEEKRGDPQPFNDLVAVEERVITRLPDPMLLDTKRPYRFGLNLFDYVNLCPDKMTVRFWARTDRGTDRSQPVALGYLIGSEIPPLQRYKKLLAGEPEEALAAVSGERWQRPEERAASLQRLAYRLWQEAGSPPGRDVEFWGEAERRLSAVLLRERAARRPSLVGAAAG